MKNHLVFYSGFIFILLQQQKLNVDQKKEELMTENNKMKQLMLYPCG